MTILYISDQASSPSDHPTDGAEHRPHHSCDYSLKWRQKQLIVKPAQEPIQMHLPPLENSQWLMDCLQRSPVRLVKLSPALEEDKVEFWADACASVGKLVFLQLPSPGHLRQQKKWLRWRLKRLLDWSAALLLLVLLLPLLLIIAVIIRLESPTPILLSQWRVGERGRLFRILKFRTMVADAAQIHHQVMADQSGFQKCENDPRITRLGHWLRRFSLDELPQLINVLRGEMSLVGPRPWVLFDALRLSPVMRQQLNSLRGITGIWQVTACSTLRDLDAVNRIDLSYLSNWSMRQDLKILLMTIPRVISRFKAY